VPVLSEPCSPSLDTHLYAQPPRTTAASTMCDRAKKSGIGADIEKKLEAKYDAEDEAGTIDAVRIWVNAVCEGLHDPIPDKSQKSMHSGLRDGVMLCKLVNKLLETDGKAKVHIQKKVTNMFVATTNIENYNNGCLQYGLAKEFTVQSTDLWEGRKGPFLNVINNIHSLGFVANGKGFGITYTGEVQRSADFD